MKIKTSELSGVALDWAVAKAAGQKIYEVNGFLRTDIDDEVVDLIIGDGGFSPSQDWSQGGPLIERYRVGFDYRTLDEGRVMATACGMKYDQLLVGCDSHLVAAMRAIVAAKLGDEVDAPEGLV